MPYNQRQSLSIKIAKQIFAAQHPFGVKRTRGEKNEDAHYIEEQQYHQNIMEYVDSYTELQVKKAKLEARIDYYRNFDAVASDEIPARIAWAKNELAALESEKVTKAL